MRWSQRARPAYDLVRSSTFNLQARALSATWLILFSLGEAVYPINSKIYSSAVNGALIAAFVKVRRSQAR